MFDIGSAAWNTDKYKTELFEKSGIGIPHHDTESNDAVVFGFMAAQFIAEVQIGYYKIILVLKLYVIVLIY